MADSGAGQTDPGKMALPLMFVSFLLIGGFLYWLSITAEPTSVAVVEGESADPNDDPTIPTVTLAEFTPNPRSWEGQEIRLRDIDVASRLGSSAFWFNLSNETPYLVKMDTLLISSGMAVSSGDRADRIIGTVVPMSDSVLDAWEAQGAFTDPTQRLEAEFATSFIQARAVDVRADAGSGGGGSGGA